MLARMRTIVSRLRSWISPRRGDAEFEFEMASHLEMLTQENIQRGMTPEEAQRAAKIRLGGVTQLRETDRELRGLPFLEVLAQDIRYAFRMLRKNPGFTAVVVLTLALGVGANTAIFSVVYAVVLKPLPYPQPGQLFNIFQQEQSNPTEPPAGRVRLSTKLQQTGMSYLNFQDLREQSQVFREMAGSQFHQLTLTGRGEPSVVDTAVVTPEFFSLFGVAPLAGRTFSSDDGKPGAPAVVVLSEALWRSTFGSDPKVIGSSINLDKRSFTIIGIMPAAFRFPVVNKREKVWIPLAQDPLFGPWMPRRGGHWLQVSGRLKPGVSAAQVSTEMDALGVRLAQAFPADNAGWLIGVVPLQQMMIGEVAYPLLLLLAAVGLVLLIASANIANLLLARATSRAREIAVRATLGAGRGRIVRQLMSETAVLGLLGGISGILLAYWGVRAMASLLPTGVPQVNEIRVDSLVLAFALLLSALAACVFGLAPAFFAAKFDLHSSLREGDGRSGEGGGSRKMRKVLVAGEISVAMILLVSAGLLIRSFARLTSTNPGFDVQHILKTDVALPQFQYSTPQQWNAFADQLLARLHAEPGLLDSAIAVPLPLTDGFVNLGFDIVGAPSLKASESRSANYVSVSPDYFRVIGIPLLAGRLFDHRDAPASARVCLISKTLARLYFPGQDPIGRRLIFAFPPDPSTPREIIGVVGDVRDAGLGSDPGPMMYVPFAQAPFWGGDIIAKTSLDPAAAASAIRRSVAEIDRDLPVSTVAKLADLLDASVAQPRFRTYLLALFAAIALLLAATGIFGVISYSVARRTREIGIRMALGASRSTVLGLILRETMSLTLIGFGVGVPCALVTSRLLRQLLFQVNAYDPLTLCAVAVLLAAVAALAAYIPVRRAMRVDPTEALRHA